MVKKDLSCCRGDPCGHPLQVDAVRKQGDHKGRPAGIAKIQNRYLGPLVIKDS
jgi:hypothetical protein